MIINWSYRFLFVHVPKTAGTAVTAKLSPYSSPQDIDICREPEADVEIGGRSVHMHKHATAVDILSVVGRSQFESLFKFGFVRNPYARIYSVYRFLKYNHRAWDGSDIMNKYRSFDEFVASDFFQTAGPDDIFHSQTFWLCDSNGNLLVDYVGRIENLNADLLAICDRIGIGIEGSTAPVNVSEPESRLPTWVALQIPRLRRYGILRPSAPVEVDLTKIYASDETRRTVERRYAESFEVFGYPLMRRNARGALSHA